MHITFHSYSLSLFFLQIKPFYTDTSISISFGVNSKAYGDNSKDLRR